MADADIAEEVILSTLLMHAIHYQRQAVSDRADRSGTGLSSCSSVVPLAATIQLSSI